MSGKTSSSHRKNLIFCAIRWIFCATIIFWLLSRSIPMLVQIDANKSKPNFTISLELTSLSERLSCLWTSTRNKILRKQAMLSYHRYGLQFEIRNKNLHFYYASSSLETLRRIQVPIQLNQTQKQKRL